MTSVSSSGSERHPRVGVERSNRFRFGLQKEKARQFRHVGAGRRPQTRRKAISLILRF
jgi:hypothetical protein